MSRAWWPRLRTALGSLVAGAASSPAGNSAQSSVALYRQQLLNLEDRLQQHIQETELLTRIRYTEWKIRQERDRQHYLSAGIRFPRTTWDSEQDAIFYQLERRMEQEQTRFDEEARRIEREERYRLEDQRRRDDYEAQAQRQREIELARLQAEREAAEIIARTLKQDLV